jgi:drug/metabolite transporter (DMT)-like permease
MMAVVLALAAALLFALGTVLQQRVAAASAGAEAMRAGFLLRLARQPQWLAGIAADAAGFACQAAALGLGRIVVVQPLLASSVVFALPLGVWLAGQRTDRGDSGYASIRIASVSGAISAAPAPCKARKATRKGSSGASAHAAENAVNTARPARKTRLRP